MSDVRKVAQKFLNEGVPEDELGKYDERWNEEERNEIRSFNGGIERDSGNISELEPGSEFPYIRDRLDGEGEERVVIEYGDTRIMFTGSPHLGRAVRVVDSEFPVEDWRSLNPFRDEMELHIESEIPDLVVSEDGLEERRVRSIYPDDGPTTFSRENLSPDPTIQDINLEELRRESAEIAGDHIQAYPRLEIDSPYLSISADGREGSIRVKAERYDGRVNEVLALVGV